MARLSWPGWLVTYKDGLPILKTVTHPSTNRARRWLTSLMRPTTLPTEPNRHQQEKKHQTNWSLPLDVSTKRGPIMSIRWYNTPHVWLKHLPSSSSISTESEQLFSTGILINVFNNVHKWAVLNNNKNYNTASGRPVVRGWRLFSRTWNHWTCPWTKQSTRLRIVHSGDWCLRLANEAIQNLPLCTKNYHY